MSFCCKRQFTSFYFILIRPEKLLINVNRSSVTKLKQINTTNICTNQLSQIMCFFVVRIS